MPEFYQALYTSPLGEVILIADDQALEGIWFQGQKYEKAGLEGVSIPFLSLEQEPGAKGSQEEASWQILKGAQKWLDVYFAGGNPDPGILPIKDKGTDFQRFVWQTLRDIPYGQTRTYKEIAQSIGCRSSQAVGGAVGRNPYLILVPCHRVLDSKGRLCGYAAGLEKKKALLDLEEATYQGEKDD